MKRTPTRILESITKRGGHATIYDICADTTLTYAYVSWNMKVLEAQNLIKRTATSEGIRQYTWSLKNNERQKEGTQYDNRNNQKL